MSLNSITLKYLSILINVPLGIFIIISLFLQDVPSSFANSKPSISNEQKEILEMDISQLLQIDVVVTSASKKPQKIHKAASAIFVITPEDIRRTGAVNLMEALRIAPGVQVAKVSQNTYAISVRGFNDRSGGDKLLVLIDGRSIYSIADGGTFWIGQDVMMEDLERIEVIRGPGASLWGSNAVNGVINIITKSSAHTQGNLLATGIGTEENGFATYRYGNKLKNGLTYRAYGKFRDRDDGVDAVGNSGFDEKQIGQMGFKADWQKNSKDFFTAQGDMYYQDSEIEFKSIFLDLSKRNEVVKSGLIQKGANILTRWTRELENDSSLKLQFYYDRVGRDAGSFLRNELQKADLEFQYNFSYEKTHEISWGLNYQYQDYNYDGHVLLIETERSNLAGMFIHDEITLIPDKWSLILGARIERNDFSGFEFQPNIRTLWTPDSKNTYWAAISRAVKIPTPRGQDAILNLFSFGGNNLIQEQKAPDLDSEILWAYELGYKYKKDNSFSYDVAIFIHDYNNLLTSFSGAAFTKNGVNITPTQNVNHLSRTVYGAEISGDWEVQDNWRLAGNYSYTHLNVRRHLKEPEHRVAMRSYLDLPHNFQFDASYYFVSRYFSKDIPYYHRLDVRLGYKVSDQLELSFVGQNLTNESHQELTEGLEQDTETQRGYYVKAILNF